MRDHYINKKKNVQIYIDQVFVTTPGIKSNSSDT